MPHTGETEKLKSKKKKRRRMEIYDPNKRYFGPQGSILCNFIPEYPPGLEILKNVFNKAAWRHDGGYSGTKRKGFIGKFKDILERWDIDIRFSDDMHDGIDEYYDEGLITEEQAELAHRYADLAYKSVRGLGWSFFRTGDAE